MYHSFFDIFSIGIGPSSSHTVGPMRAATRFVEDLRYKTPLKNVHTVNVSLYGSLALTGVGHGTINAVIYGLMGLHAATIDTEMPYIQNVKNTKRLTLGQECDIAFDLDKNILLEKETFLPEHSNGMRFTAFDANEQVILTETFFSIGGGTIATETEIKNPIERKHLTVPHTFSSCKELMDICERENLTISDIVMINEESLRSFEKVRRGVLNINQIMQDTIDKGLRTEGTLPGGLQLKRRAPELYHRLEEKFRTNDVDPLMIVDWINMWAFAVSEENAAGGRIVTAPTMGSAGVVPAVLRYYQRFAASKSPFEIEQGTLVFLTTASAICSLYRTNASISGAEVGCQGEVGVACSMAAAGLAAAMGATNQQIENAAEIAMEHNLGLTCDPVCGLVQVPCIERNAMGAMKAVNSARMAMRGTGKHFVSLDSVIKTMYETGLNLSSQYKETSLGGLAVNALTC